jgi:hypothetical protein
LALALNVAGLTADAAARADTLAAIVSPSVLAAMYGVDIAKLA